jgi:hypothetical protein
MLHLSYTSFYIIGMMKSRVRWTRHVERMGKYVQNFVRKSEGKRQFGIYKRTSEDNIKMDSTQLEYEDVD